MRTKEEYVYRVPVSVWLPMSMLATFLSLAMAYMMFAVPTASYERYPRARVAMVDYPLVGWAMLVFFLILTACSLRWVIESLVRSLRLELGPESGVLPKWTLWGGNKLVGVAYERITLLNVRDAGSPAHRMLIISGLGVRAAVISQGFSDKGVFLAFYESLLSRCPNARVLGPRPDALRAEPGWEQYN